MHETDLPLHQAHRRDMLAEGEAVSRAELASPVGERTRTKRRDMVGEATVDQVVQAQADREDTGGKTMSVIDR